MAEENKSWWDEFVEWFLWMGKNMITWVSNLIARKPRWENNTSAKELLFWIEDEEEKPKKSTAPISLSTPTLNKVADEDVKQWWIDVVNKITPDTTQKPQESSNISTVDLTWNIITDDTTNPLDTLEVEDLAKRQEEEKNAEDENWLQTWWRRIKWWGNSIMDNNLEAALESINQSKEKHFALSYDPASEDITELVINEPQWFWDDTANRFFSRWEWNKQIFENLLQEYNEASWYVENSNYTEAEKNDIQSRLFDSLYDEVNKRELLRAFRNDHYSDWNLIQAAYWDDTKVFWRMKDKFTQDELRQLAKNSVDEWVYTPTKEQFAKYIQMYQENQQLANDLSLKSYYWEAGAPEKANISYRLTEETITNLRSAQAEKVNQSVRNKLLELEESWAITPVKRNEIEARFMNTINSNLANAYYWMESPLAYYATVKNKNGPLTSWERAILWYGPWMQKLLDDYTSALEKWALVSLDTWIVDGELVHPAEVVDWMSINDFFVNAIRDSNIQAWWVDLLATESVIDAMQAINNNIWDLYWQWKWNNLRKFWHESEKYLWQLWYTAWELASLGIMWWTSWVETLFWTDTNVWDYMMADLTGLMNVTTDEWDWWRLMKKYWLISLENIPELAWETWMATRVLSGLKLPKDLEKWKEALEASKKLEQIKKMWEAKSKLNAFEKITSSIRKWLWVTAEWNWSRTWLQRYVDEVLKVTEWKNQTINNLVKIWANITKWAVQDQLIDWLASYYDSEAYSDASALLSLWLTWITEILAPTLKYSQAGKRIWNLLRGADMNQWTAWRVMSYLTKDPEAMKNLEDLFWKWNVTFDLLKVIWSDWDEYEDIMRVAYNLLNPDAQKAVWEFSKKLAFQKLSELKNIDWNSAYWQELLRIVNARGTNIADMFKYIFWITWQVEVWWFLSRILLKNWAEWLQTRLLKSEYDVLLDNLEWWFRKRLSQWFTKSDIEQIEKKTPYKDLLDKWTPKEEFFVKDWDKYYLTSEWAKKFWLDVSDYTDAMRRADLLRETAEDTKQFLNEKTEQLMLNKWMTPETIKRLAESWWFQKTVDALSNVVCKI